MNFNGRCPACKATQTEYGPIRDVFHHITNQARCELFAREFVDKNKQMPHVDFLKEHFMAVDEILLRFTSKVSFKERNQKDEKN